MCVDRVWVGRVIFFSRTGKSFSLILSNWDNKSPSFIDITSLKVDIYESATEFVMFNITTNSSI